MSTLHSDEPNPLDTTGLCLLSLDGGGVLSGNVISSLSGGEAVRLPSVRGDRTSPSTVGVNRAVCGV